MIFKIDGFPGKSYSDPVMPFTRNTVGGKTLRNLRPFLINGPLNLDHKFLRAICPVICLVCRSLSNGRHHDKIKAGNRSTY